MSASPLTSRSGFPLLRRHNRRAQTSKVLLRLSSTPLTFISEDSGKQPSHLPSALRHANEFIFCKLCRRAEGALSAQLSCLPPCAPASTYLVLADVVVVCGALSSLLQRDKDETSEISGAGCHEDHWRADRERMWINSSRRPTVAPTHNQGHITGCRVSADDARNKPHFCERVH